MIAFNIILLCKTVVRIREERNLYRVLVGKPEGKRPLGRQRRRWEDGVRMDLRQTGGGVEWIQLAHDRDRWRAVVNAEMNLGSVAIELVSTANVMRCGMRWTSVHDWKARKDL
jgi:hypothetical protein